MKKVLIVSFVVAMVLMIGVPLPVYTAPLLLSDACSFFVDDWFPTIMFSYDYCTTPEFGSVAVNAGGLKLTSSLSMGIGMTATDTDATISQDYSGRELSLGQTVQKQNLFEEFKIVDMGDYATMTRAVYTFPLLNSDGEEIGKRKVADVLYRIRVSKCDATFSVDAEDETEDPSFRTNVFDVAESKAKEITSTMRRLEICKAEGSSVVQNVPTTQTPSENIVTEPTPIIDEDKITKSGNEELLNREPQLTSTVTTVDTTGKGGDGGVKYRADIVNGQVQIKYPGSEVYIDVKVGTQIPIGSTIFTGIDSSVVIAIIDVGVIETLSFSEIVITESGIVGTEERYNPTINLELRVGEIEVNVEGGLYQATLQVETTNVVAGVRGTNFWVSHNKDTKETIVVVYEGTVEVRDKTSNKVVNVSPAKDTPGVISITTEGIQWISDEPSGSIKQQGVITIIGLILVVIIGGFLLYRKVKRGKKLI